MASIDAVSITILFGAVLVLAGIMSSLVALRFGAPLLLVFLLVGMLAGESGVGGIKFDDVRMAYTVGSVALGLILFDGGLRTRLATFRNVLAPAGLLASPAPASRRTTSTPRRPKAVRRSDSARAVKDAGTAPSNRNTTRSMPPPAPSPAAARAGRSGALIVSAARRTTGAARRSSFVRPALASRPPFAVAAGASGSSVQKKAPAKTAPATDKVPIRA